MSLEDAISSELESVLLRSNNEKLAMEGLVEGNPRRLLLDHLVGTVSSDSQPGCGLLNDGPVRERFRPTPREIPMLVDRLARLGEFQDPDEPSTFDDAALFAVNAAETRIRRGRPELPKQSSWGSPGREAIIFVRSRRDARLENDLLCTADRERFDAQRRCTWPNEHRVAFPGVLIIEHGVRKDPARAPTRILARSHVGPPDRVDADRRPRGVL